VIWVSVIVNVINAALGRGGLGGMDLVVKAADRLGRNGNGSWRVVWSANETEQASDARASKKTDSTIKIPAFS